ncbi:stage II sporulation protein P [Hydrogeniiclostridium mannosilyticum]|uniref:stage II sporulation protein P n=1 Tax=Hydrogeniiclostridium mannosilyticum TaxID=2764322 RepID=UPI0015A9EDF5|nr:stage II sporulation protein P [Hydrogeniiclostridium mannosilyticum]MBS6163143.1 stage II sporulation protein P [Clostridiales bacterium]
MAIRMPLFGEPDAVLAAAGFIFPDGAAGLLREDAGRPDASAQEPEPSAAAQQSEAPAGEESQPAESAQSSRAEEGGNSSDGAVPTMAGDGITEMTMANTGLQYGNLWVKNSNTNHGIDIGEELNRQPAVKLKRDGSVEILIYHTHTTEAFQGETRTQDNSRNVVAVGDEIEKKLKAAGYGVVHDTTCHDYPSYNGSYDRSGETIQRNLEKYPGIQVTLDIHRDALGSSDNRIKPTVVINGKKAAQIMVVSGCDDNGQLGFPDWEYNLRLAVRIQRSVSDLYPTLARPLHFCPKKYNEHMTRGSLLVEFGTDGSTLEEVLYSGELFGNALVDTLNDLVVEE